jgi:hypothetical protein
MMRGWKKVADIADTEVRDVLCRALRAHEIPYDREFHPRASLSVRPVFDRVSVEAHNLCCAKTLYSSIMANRGQNV